MTPVLGLALWTQPTVLGAGAEGGREAAGHRYGRDGGAEPDPVPALARAAARVHRAADHVRAALQLRLRRGDPDARIPELLGLPDPRDHRPEHRLRRLHDGDRAERGPPQG